MGKQLAKLVCGEVYARLVQLRIDRSQHADAVGCTEPTPRADHLFTANQRKTLGLTLVVWVASSAGGDADG